MLRTVFAILSIALLSACGLKGPLYMTNEDGKPQPPTEQTQPQQAVVPSDTLLKDR